MAAHIIVNPDMADGSRQHFKHGEPTLEFPDPESASPYDKPSTPRRPSPKKRTSCTDSNSTNVIQASEQPSEHRIDQHIHVVRVSLSGKHEENIPPENVSSKRSDDHPAHAVNYLGEDQVL
ncbi:uncharacterized protein [Argopecten irradians]|uniref:uncharacterized protein n=1 Tax=Argopecten irradians TaxID=31199 RepID=UPI003719C3C1